MKLDKLLRNNVFLINSSICLVLLLMICYLGVSSPFKKTFSVTVHPTVAECENSCNGTCMTVEDGFVCSESNSEVYSVIGDYYWNDTILNDPGIYGLLEEEKTYDVRFHSNDVLFNKIAFAAGDDDDSVGGVIYYGNNGNPIHMEIIDNTFKMIKNIQVGPVDIGSYKYMTFLEPLVFDNSALYAWFIYNTKPDNKCYYNKQSGRFEWTNVSTVGELQSKYETEAECSNARLFTLDGNGGEFVIGDDIGGYKRKELEKSGTFQDEFQLNYITKIITKKIKLGYNFVSWNDRRDNRGSEYKEDTIISMRNGNLTLYAIWEPITYNIKFDANGGSGTMDDQTFTYDTTQKLNSNKFTKANSKFIGWAYDNGETTTIYSDGQEIKNIISTSQDVVFKAVWEENSDNVNISFNKYKVDNNKKYVYVTAGTTKSEFENNVSVTNGYHISVDTKNSNQVLYTGGQVKVLKSDNSIYSQDMIYTIIVIGDTDGDGKVSMVDYMYIYEHKSTEYKRELTGIYLLAADFDQNDLVNMVDYMNIYEYVKAQQ